MLDLKRQRPTYYAVDPNITDIEARYWASHRVIAIKATFEQFLETLDQAVSVSSRSIPRSIGGGTSSLRKHYTVVNAPETDDLFYFLDADVDHIRPGMPTTTVDPRAFYRGEDHEWGGIDQNLDVPRAITDTLVIEAVLADETERPSHVDLYAVKGPAGNGKTIVLKRAAWVAAHDYDKMVLFLKPGGAIRREVVEEIFRYANERIFLFVDQAALYVEELDKLLSFARQRRIKITVVVAERDAEWNVRCEALDRYGVREFPVRYLSEKSVRALLLKLEEHDSLGLLKELPTFEQRVERLVGGAQRQLLVALHEATLGKAFEDIVYDEYRRIIPAEAQALYLDICTLNRLGVPVRAGLISRVSGITFTQFQDRLFKPLEHIVSQYSDRYSGDHVYTARHQHVAEMVFACVLPEPERKFDQIVGMMNGMNLDYSSDRIAFGQLVRGHWVGEAFHSRELGRVFFDAAMRVAPREAFLYQQRGIYEMQQGGDLELAEKYLNEALSLEPHNKSIQHSFAVLARRQALATSNPLLRQKLRERARSQLSPLVGLDAEQAHGFHTAAQIALDDLRDLLDALGGSAPEQMAERRIVELARDFERFLQEGLQKAPLNEHLLSLEAEFRRVVAQEGRAELALKKAFEANPRQDWIAIRLARMLDGSGKRDEGIGVLVKCLQVNPNSKRAHFELAMMYMREPAVDRKDLILDHLRRSFTLGDQNYEPQFWYARQAFMVGKYDEAAKTFSALRNAPIPSREKNQVRGTIVDAAGGAKVFVGEIVVVEPNYLFLHCADFPENVFVHRSNANDVNREYLKRGIKLACTVGFSMRGPAGGSIRLLN